MKTRDRAGVEEIYTSDQLGPKQSLTPEGFLLCKDVPLARTGWMYYAAGEVPVEADPSGVIRVFRGKDELLRTETIASIVGKPVVNDHPDDDVVPDNWKEHTVGIALNVRAEEPADEPDVGLIVADLLVMDPAAIKAIKDKKREISLGYDADYETTSPGLGKQTNILGNHIALVDKGRCGPRCSIGDQATVNQELQMARRNASGTRRVALAAHIRKAFKDAEAAALEEMTGLGSDGPADGGDDLPEDDDDKHTHVHIHMNGEGAPGKPAAAAPTNDNPDQDPAAPAGGDDPVEARFAALEAGHQQILKQLADLAKLVQGGGEPSAAPAPAQGSQEAGTLMDDEDPPPPEAGKTTDSAALATSWQELIAQAELLVPGVRTPTFDAKLPRKSTVDNMCKFRRQVLKTLDSQSAGHDLLTAVGSTKDLDGMNCAATAALFKAAAGAKRIANNANATRDRTAPTPTPAVLPARSVADLQKAFDKLYGTQS